MRRRGNTRVTSYVGAFGAVGAQKELAGYSENRARIEFQFGQHSNVYGVSTDGTTGTLMNNDVSVFPIVFDYELHGAGVYGPFLGFANATFAITVIETMFEDESIPTQE